MEGHISPCLPRARCQDLWFAVLRGPACCFGSQFRKVWIQLACAKGAATVSFCWRGCSSLPGRRCCQEPGGSLLRRQQHCGGLVRERNLLQLLARVLQVRGRWVDRWGYEVTQWR